MSNAPYTIDIRGKKELLSSKKMELVITNIAKELNIDNYLYGTQKQCVCAIIKNEISNNNICPQKS